MASIIQGYTYDIFISYRHKDNKYDGWVTEFVNNLKRELDGTFKEEISVYFDINKKDGLLDTHIVDASLKEKLKCLVFIPILSQTYCDPKSFAWMHEFVAFNKLALNDHFGRDITLANGNIASRILPVKIHEIEVADQKVIEEEIGGVLRAIEFIYQEPGVNRPLGPNDDPKENINKTKYRNQVNKVANAIKDIITGLKNFDRPGNKIPKQVFTRKTAPPKKRKTKFYLVTFLALCLVTIGYFVAPLLSKSSSTDEKSIAILPFNNFSGDPEQVYFSDAMVDEILDRLCKFGDMEVSSRTSSMIYRDSKLSIKEIGKELGVSAILEGSVRKIGNQVRIIVQLIDTRSDRHLWSETYDREYKDIFKLTSEIAETVASKLKVVITSREKHLVEKSPTLNMEAYNDYIMGRSYWRKWTPDDLKIALKYFESAVDKDNGFALAYVGISDVWYAFYQLGVYDPSDPVPMENLTSALNKAVELDSMLAEVHYSLGNLKASSAFWDWDGGEKEYKKAISINPNYADSYAAYSNLLAVIGGHTEESIELIDKALKLDPQNIFTKFLYSATMHWARRYDEAAKGLKDILNIEPEYYMAMQLLPCVYHVTGNYEDELSMWRSFMKTYYSNNKVDIDNIFESNLPFSTENYKKTLGQLADTLVSQSGNSYFDPFIIAIFYNNAGENGRALYLLESSYKMRNPNILFLSNPVFDSLKDEDRYQNLCKKLNIQISV